MKYEELSVPVAPIPLHFIKNVIDMDIEHNAKNLQSLIEQLSIDKPKSSSELLGKPEEILAGLRELYLLKLITGTVIHGHIRDPLGYQWIGAENILLTRRGIQAGVEGRRRNRPAASHCTRTPS